MELVSRIFDWFFERRLRRIVGPLDRMERHFAELIPQHWKEGETRQYAFRFWATRRPMEWVEKSRPVFCRETQFGFVLYAKSETGNIPLAYIGFDITSDQLFIRQLGKIREEDEFFGSLRWEHLLFSFATRFAKELKLASVRTCPTRALESYPFKGDESCPLSPDMRGSMVLLAMWLHRAFERIPLDCGFKAHPEGGNILLIT